MITKSEQLYRDLVTFINTTDTNLVKRRVKNSVKNNRVLTVNQVITYLKSSDKRGHRSLGRRLERAYGIYSIRAYMKKFRSSRTDAYDINEFRIGYLLVLATGGKSARKSIGQKLG